jgi:hypothetical protein
MALISFRIAARELFVHLAWLNLITDDARVHGSSFPLSRAVVAIPPSAGKRIIQAADEVKLSDPAGGLVTYRHWKLARDPAGKTSQELKCQAATSD